MSDHVIPILRKLVAFDTTSRNPNLNLIDYVAELLKKSNVTSELVPNADNTKANLITRIGPDVSGGILLSGHTDVVPIDGQSWLSDPWTLTQSKDGLLFGRGTSDMKGFIACVLDAVPGWAAAKLQRPIYIVLSYDEEIGCLGVRSALDVLQKKHIVPDICIIGEPTQHMVAHAHKSRADIDVHFKGTGGHASKIGDPTITSANDLAVVFDHHRQTHRNTIGCKLGDVDLLGPASMAVTRWQIENTHNIIPADAHVHYDFRGAPGITSEQISSLLTTYAHEAIQNYVADGKTGLATIVIEPRIGNAGFRCADLATINMGKKIAGTQESGTVEYVCEAARFAEIGLADRTVICGPGSILQAHQPNEYIHRDELTTCAAMMRRVGAQAAVLRL